MSQRRLDRGDQRVVFGGFEEGALRVPLEDAAVLEAALVFGDEVEVQMAARVAVGAVVHLFPKYLQLKLFLLLKNIFHNHPFLNFHSIDLHIYFLQEILLVSSCEKKHYHSRKEKALPVCK